MVLSERHAWIMDVESGDYFSDPMASFRLQPVITMPHGSAGTHLKLALISLGFA